VPTHPLALERIHDYLQAAGHGEDAEGSLFRPLKNPAGQGKIDRPLTHGAVYHRVLRKHAKAAGIDGKSFGPHALRATAATNALDRGADLAQGAGMALGTPTESTTRLYDRRRSRPEMFSRLQLEFWVKLLTWEGKLSGLEFEHPGAVAELVFLMQLRVVTGARLPHLPQDFEPALAQAA
jgi:integrase